MPVNNFNTGRDVTLSVITSYGPQRFSLITAFSSKPDITEQKIKGLDGVVRHLRFWDGWSGRFELERRDQTADSYFAQLEQDYYSGINEQPATIYESITEANGATTQWQYIRVLLKLDDAGDYAGDKAVRQTISFVAARRKQMA